MTFETIFNSTVIGFSIGAIISIPYELFKSYRIKKANAKYQKAKEDIALRIRLVSDSLNNSASELTEIQKHLKERIDFVIKLSEDAKKAEEIASLNAEQVNSINSLLSDNLKKESKKSFWHGVIVNIVFFILGSILTLAVSFFTR